MQSNTDEDGFSKDPKMIRMLRSIVMMIIIIVVVIAATQPAVITAMKRMTAVPTITRPVTTLMRKLNESHHGENDNEKILVLRSQASNTNCSHDRTTKHSCSDVDPKPRG